MKICLIRLDFREKDAVTHPPDIPLGLLYIAGAIEKAGYELTVLDLNRQEMIDLTQFDVVGISMLPLIRKQAYEIIEDIKKRKPSIKIVLGGTFPSSIPLILLKHYPIDAVVIGEGEETIVDLLNHWRDGLDIKEVKGIADKYGIHESRPPMDLTNLDMPAYHYTDLSWWGMTYAKNHPNYESNGIILNNEKVCLISGSRGCPNLRQCIFCNSPSFWCNRYRWRTSENILNEIEYLYKIHNVRVFGFNDDAFPVNKKQCMEFCEGIKNRNLKIAWKSDTRADCIDEDMIKVMKESGCFMVALGIESGSEKILKNIKKNLDLNRAKSTISLLKKYGIRVYVLLMVGNIGETQETINETIKFIQETNPDECTWISGVMVIPGTELYEIAKKQGLINDDYWIKKEDGLPYYTYELSMNQIMNFSSQLVLARRK